MSNNVKIIPPEKTFEIGDLVLVDPLYIGDELAAEIYFSQETMIKEHDQRPADGSAQQWPWGIIIESSPVRNKIKYKISFGTSSVWVNKENIRHMEKDA